MMDLPREVTLINDVSLSPPPVIAIFGEPGPLVPMSSLPPHRRYSPGAVVILRYEDEIRVRVLGGPYDRKAVYGQLARACQYYEIYDHGFIVPSPLRVYASVYALSPTTTTELVCSAARRY